MGGLLAGPLMHPCPDRVSAKPPPVRLGWRHMPSACDPEAGQHPGVEEGLKCVQGPG